jgi:hypothetical protein
MASITITIPNWLDRICAWPVVVYRLLKYGYTYRRIPLGEGRFTIVEPGDFYRLNHFQWFANGNSERIYAVRNILATHEKGKILPLHREIMRPPEGLVIDHKNGDSLDNRRSNLRLATRAQNSYNCQKRKNTTSKYIGVFFNKRRKYWEAQIRHKGKHIWLGGFHSEIEAAKAYDAAAKKCFGEFARLNFPREDCNVEIRTTND